ncbi:hypothetical protein [Bacillus andreraoultii]|uniref:hypothetical protein n=1 Tax=Bacillus andreraoultii TaxID=1499685 RepID=UPI00053B841D|nr:hypothetical protein [Bacillus andreraoultii]
MYFDIVKRFEYGNDKDIRIIKKKSREEYGIQTSTTIEPSWGYTKDGAERTFNRLVEAVTNPNE